MRGQTMDTYDEFLDSASLPDFLKLTQPLDTSCIGNVSEQMRHTLLASGLLDRIRPGSSIALTVGSREIANIDVIIRTICDVLKEHGTKPFIIPAMGSHGGAVAENQKTLIAHFGITEETMGVPIRATMDTVQIGTTEVGDPVFFDRFAAEADVIIPIGRIKVHTCFHGPIESGILKMLAIGCGKQKGAALIHQYGFSSMSTRVTQSALVALRNLPIPFGVGIIENFLHQTYSLHVVANENIYSEEQELLKTAYKLMPRIPYDKIDLLIVDEIGKNISGTGMDPNITGRSAPLGSSRPFPERIVLLDLSKASDGSAYGMGNADIITQRFLDKVVFENSIPNGITSLELRPLMTPVTMPDDKRAILLALQTLSRKVPDREPHVVWIHNTLCMHEFYISTALAKDCAPSDPVDIDPTVLTPQFDEKNNYCGMAPRP